MTAIVSVFLSSLFVHYSVSFFLSTDILLFFNSQIEDGWWMGKKNGKIGAFPSNFVKEIFVAPKGKAKQS